MRILVTGAFGWTATSIIQTLRQAEHEICAFDLPTAICPDSIKPLVSDIITGDIADFEQVNLAVRSVHSIVHLAVAVDASAYRAPQLPFSVNVQGTYNLFEAARRYVVQRIVLMSSAAVHLYPTIGETLSALTDWKSSADEDHLYDLTKRLQEEIARDFCATFGMSAVVLRAGHIVDGRAEVDPQGRPLSALDYCRGGWICRYDLAKACLKALELGGTGYNAFHVIGAAAAHQHFDVDRTERELGLAFESRFEQYR
jgi:nucleoside-diphosphate-sugar epimerase